MSVNRRYFVLGIVVVILLTGLAVSAFVNRKNLAIGVESFIYRTTGSPLPNVGSPAPDFELESLTGERLKLSSKRGIPVVINFWATWCAPCVLEMPGIERTYAKYPGKFSVIAVNAGESSFRVHQFAKDIGITFDVLMDPDNKIQQLYKVSGYPTTFILDSRGIIRVKYVGSLDEDQLVKYISQLELNQ